MWIFVEPQRLQLMENWYTTVSWADHRSQWCTQTTITQGHLASANTMPLALQLRLFGASINTRPQFLVQSIFTIRSMCFTSKRLFSLWWGNPLGRTATRRQQMWTNSSGVFIFYFAAGRLKTKTKCVISTPHYARIDQKGCKILYHPPPYIWIA